jgi:SNF2 family DNA or RNA helicase
MVNFVNPGILGDLPTFRRVFQVPIEKGRDKSASPADKMIGQSRSEELARLTSTFVLRRTSAILQGYLPPRSELVVFVHLSDLQRQLYERLLASTVARSVVSGRMTSSDSALLLIGGWLTRSPLLVVV